jgi:serine O-acetyltransferase
VQIVYGIDISYKASISPGVLIVHGIGFVIGNGVVICSGVKIYHGVTLGIADNGRENDGFPTICSGVTIGAGACVLGRVKVGENSFVGANAVVLKDVPRDSIAVGNPLRVLERTR